MAKPINWTGKGPTWQSGRYWLVRTVDNYGWAWSLYNLDWRWIAHKEYTARFPEDPPKTWAGRVIRSWERAR